MPRRRAPCLPFVALLCACAARQPPHAAPPRPLLELIEHAPAFALARTYETAVFTPARQPDEAVTDDYRIVPFTLARATRVQARIRARTVDAVLVPERELPAGDHYLVISYDDVRSRVGEARELQLELYAGQPLALQQAQTCLLVERRRGEMAGQVEHDDVAIDTGRFALTRTDFAAEGIGPGLRFERSFHDATQPDDVTSPLGPGWSASPYRRVEIVAAGRDVEPHHLPPWVVQQHLQFHAASELPHDDGPLRAVRIDGVSFRKYGSSWGTERGRRAQLIEQDGTFIVVMVDGTRSTFGRAARDVRWSKDDGRLSAQLGRLLGGRLQRIEDRYGTPVMFSYADGPAGVQVSQMVDAVGRTFSFQYVHADVAPNAFHPSSVRLVRVDALGSDGAELEYDRASGRLSNVRIGRFVEHYDYEAVPGATAFPEHRLTRITRSDGTSEQTLSLAYHWASDLPAALFATHPGLSPQQVVARVGFEDERFVFFNYHSDDGNRRSVTFPDGTEVYELDPSGNAVSVQGRGKSRRWQWGIDSAFAGNDLLSVQDLITNQTTRYEYDDRGNRVKTIGPDGGVLRDTFDEWGLLVRRILPNGDVHREQRDSLGNLLHEADVDGTFTDYLYGPGGLPTQGSNQQGVQWLYQYDEDQNLERIDHGDRRYTRFEHDAYGRLLRETSPEGKVDEHRYDTLGREVYRRVDGKETVITYDVLDRATESAPAAR